MKVCLVLHGYPPELVGGTENSVQGLARGLAARGHDVVVVAGSLDHSGGFRTTESSDVDPASGRSIRVLRIHRADLFFDHWQKSASARVAQAFAEILREEQPDLVHVHHWIRLTRDLVFTAASEGVPAVVTCHDLWSSCLVAFRVRSDTKEFCEEPLGPMPCIQCAGNVPPKTPWVTLENQFLAVTERRADLVRELELARAVVVPSRAHADALGRYLGLEPERLALHVLGHGRDLELAARAKWQVPAPGDQLVLGCWSHLTELKGADLILDAIVRLEDPGRVRLHLAGDESDPGYAGRLRERAAGLDVHFHGRYEVERLGEHPVTDVHAMVSGSRAHESWGLVVDEAARLGLPMLLPRSGAFPERLAEGQGALFYEPRDPASLAALLTRILEDPDVLSRTRAALPPALSVVPSVEEHLNGLLALYEGVVEAGAPDRPTVDWWRAKLQIASEEEWDASYARRTPEELGFQ